MGSRIGVMKVAAGRIGVSVDTYLSNIALGLKWCMKCRSWSSRNNFCSDSTRGDGLSSTCKSCSSTGRPIGWRGSPAINPAHGRSGPAPLPARAGDKMQARHRVNVEVGGGRRPHPNSLPCADCGHIWSGGERRHEYDHYLGYDAPNHLNVQSVCTLCHTARDNKKMTRTHCDRSEFVERWPECFLLPGCPKLPLKIGIHKDILAACIPDSWLLRAMLDDYTGGRTYLQEIVEGAARIGLDGLPAGTVSKAEAEFAEKRLRKVNRVRAAQHRAKQDVSLAQRADPEMQEQKAHAA